ncbi:MAG: hypothetical protein KAT01_11005, partial [Candidatus Aminicenantes bacterium]|nr:hypothetical protein [Candidatus Aminicenantes bacterium]
MKNRRKFWIHFMFFALFFTAFSIISCDSQNFQSQLTKEYDLSLNDQEGDVDYFRMKTIYYHGNHLGTMKDRDEVLGSFQREVLKVSQESLVAKYTWKDVRIGHSPTIKKEITEWKPLSFAEGFTYETDLFGIYFLETIDTTDIPKTMDGMRFWVNIMDAHAQFELLRTETHGSISQIKKIGDRVSTPGAHQEGGWDFPPLITDSTFANGDYDTMFVGLSLADEKTCAVLEYINADSRLSSKMQMTPKMLFYQDGTSNFWGHIYVDLESGKLIKGDLYEYVIVQIEGLPFSAPMRLFERRLVEIE